MKLYTFQYCFILLCLAFIRFNQHMFSWLKHCLGGVTVTTQFQKARISCTYPNWQIPEAQHLSTMLKIFRGDDPTMNAQVALNSLLMHLEQDEQYQNPAFVLKNLLILDILSDEKIFLGRISQYYNGKLLYMEGNSLTISSVIKDLISTYYVYIKQKCKHYMEQQMMLTQKQTRKQYLQQATSHQILAEVSRCFKIQKSILIISDKFSEGNKNPPLIQHIFCSLLKTYIFCYSIVVISIHSLIRRIDNLNKSDLQYLQKLIKHFNKDYTRSFLLFIERNKIIQAFKEIKYNQMITINDRISELVHQKLIYLTQKAYSDPNAQIIHDIPQNLKKQLIIQYITDSKLTDVSTEIPLKRRIPLVLTNSAIKANQEQVNSFENYQSFYSQHFIIDFTDLNQQIKEDSERINLKLNDTAILYRQATQPSLCLELTQQSNKFQKNIWDLWDNIYAY